MVPQSTVVWIERGALWNFPLSREYQLPCIQTYKGNGYKWLCRVNGEGLVYLTTLVQSDLTYPHTSVLDKFADKVRELNK